MTAVLRWAFQHERWHDSPYAKSNPMLFQSEEKLLLVLLLWRGFLSPSLICRRCFDSWNQAGQPANVKDHNFHMFLSLSPQLIRHFQSLPKSFSAMQVSRSRAVFQMKAMR